MGTPKNLQYIYAVYLLYSSKNINFTENDETLGQNPPFGSQSTHESDVEECPIETNEEETKHFLRIVGMTFNDLQYMQNSNIVNVRVFKSSTYDSYAFVSSWLFQSFLEGQLLVELYCIKELPDGATALFIEADSIELFLGKPYSQVGIE